MPALTASDDWLTHSSLPPIAPPAAWWICGTRFCSLEFGIKAKHVIREAFSTVLEMRMPVSAGTPSVVDASRHGFGDWIVMVALISRMLRKSPGEIRMMRVSQAFALVAADNHLAGYIPKGADYLEREAGSGENIDFFEPVPNEQARSNRWENQKNGEKSEWHENTSEDIRSVSRTDNAEQPRNER